MPTQLCCFALGPDAVGHAARGETTSLTEVFERLLMAESGYWLTVNMQAVAYLGAKN